MTDTSHQPFDPVVNVGLVRPAPPGLMEEFEVAYHVDNARDASSYSRHHVALELLGDLLGHRCNLSARDLRTI